MKGKIEMRRTTIRQNAGGTFAILVWCATLVWLFSSGMALADRHCFPSYDGYFAARNSIEMTAQDPAQRISEARGYIAGAQADAEICGCLDLQSALSDIANGLKDEAVSLHLARTTILGAEATISAAINACH